jgi:predicted phage-related endonuclease
MNPLGDRTTYLGATDIAALAGLSSWKAPIQVYEEKAEGRVDDASTVMEWGLLLEDPICKGYEKQTGRRLFRRNEIVHPDHPFIRFHPDRLVRGEPGVFDAKSTWVSTSGYGEPGTDEVPPGVKAQMVLYCGATGREWADLGVLRRRPPLDIYTVRADPELYEWLIEEAVRFWNEHVVAKVEPPPDGTEAYRRHLSAKFPRDLGSELVATPEQALMADELREAIAAAKAAEEHKTALENRIRAAMGDATVLIGPGFRCTWKVQAGRPAWKDIALAVGATPDLIEQHTPEGPRVFRTTFTDTKGAAA